MGEVGLFLIILIPAVAIVVALCIRFCTRKQEDQLEEQNRARVEYDIAEAERALYDYLQSSWESSSFADGQYYMDKAEPRNGSG